MSNEYLLLNTTKFIIKAKNNSRRHFNHSVKAKEILITSKKTFEFNQFVMSYVVQNNNMITYSD